MKWHHIMDKQPKHDEEIVQCDRPYEGHYPIGTRRFYLKTTWKEHLEWCKEFGWPQPDFWWILAKDFPWPDKKVEKKLSKDLL